MTKPKITKGDPESIKAYNKWHYKMNKEMYLAKAKLHNKKQGSKINELLLKYLQDNPCIDCGEPDPIVLQFDHRDRETKSFSIGNVRGHGYSVKRVLLEVAKCDIRCANCHARRTYKQRGYTSKN